MSETTTPTPEELLADGALTVRAAVEFSGLPRTELYRVMGTGELPYFQPGEKLRLIPKRGLVTYLAARYAAHRSGRRPS